MPQQGSWVTDVDGDRRLDLLNNYTASIRGSPAHGAGALNSINELPLVIIKGHTCSGPGPHFTIRAILHVTRDFESTRTMDLDQEALQIQRAPNSTLQRSGARVARPGR
jgi:hypothetical protein